LDLHELYIKDTNIKNLYSLSITFPSKIIPNICVVEDMNKFQKSYYIFVVTETRTIHRIEIKILNQNKVQFTFTIRIKR
jgi:hypothetical protein